MDSATSILQLKRALTPQRSFDKGIVNVYGLQETEGGGLVCHGTGDPEEVDENQGILVGVTVVINIGLPSLHSRVGLFNQWITDGSWAWESDGLLMAVGLIINCL